MKIKTSITISDYLIKEIDDITRDTHNRSAFIEEAIKVYINKNRKNIRDKKDLEIINEKENILNSEADDVLSYQVKI